MLPLSSVARDLIVTFPLPVADHVSLQVTLAPAGDIVVAGCQVEPPSVDTSTPATTPPPESVAAPLIVTVLPFVNVAPGDGEEMVEAGGV
jgi:hypothetical protein